MKIVTLRVAVRAEEDATKLADELYQLICLAYNDADDDAVPLLARVVEPTPEDEELLAARRGSIAPDGTCATCGELPEECTCNPDADPAEPNNCAECARSYGPHYRGPCEHN